MKPEIEENRGRKRGRWVGNQGMNVGEVKAREMKDKKWKIKKNGRNIREKLQVKSIQGVFFFIQGAAELLPIYTF